MRTLVALDLDGTLLDEQGGLPAGHGHAVRELRRLGVLVAIVTGRPLLTARGAYVGIGGVGPLVAFNGGWVGVPGHPPLAVATLSAEDVRAVVATLKGWPGALCAYPDEHTWLMDRVTAHTVRWSAFYQVAIGVMPERFVAWEGPSHKLMWVATPADLPAAVAHLQHHLGQRFQIVVSQDDRVEILPWGIHKGWGLERLARHLGVDRAHVWAVGDADNDLEMLEWAGHGCAMGQAHQRLKDRARHVLPSIHARGLCALPHLIQRHG